MNKITKEFLKTQDSIYNLTKKFNISSQEIIKALKEDGFLYAKPGAISKVIINLKFAADEYLANETLNIKDICKKYNISHTTFPKYLKEYLGIKIEKRVKHTFDFNYFDSIDTEEKAYWLGFIWADGYISSSPLKLEDKNHLKKLQKELNTERPILTNNNRCRLLVNSKHFWETLNNYGCIPKKSLVLKFPDISIFNNTNLIRHFIRGYFDGDGCISYYKVNNTICKPTCSLIGTKEFLNSIKELLNDQQIIVNNIIHKDKRHITSNTYIFSITNIETNIKFLNFLYNNSNVYLDRKYNRYQFLKNGHALIDDIINNCNSYDQ